MNARKTRRRSRLCVLLCAVPLTVLLLAVVLLALVAGSAPAQTAGNACEGKLTGAGRQAELSFGCNFNVNGLEIFSNKDATIRGTSRERKGKDAKASSASSQY